MIPHCDGLEIHPCRTERDRNGSTFVERCEADAAEFWSVYGHLCRGGLECFEDFATEAEAEAFAEELATAWPHLRAQGFFG